MNRHQRRLTKKQMNSQNRHVLDRLNHLINLATQHQNAGRFSDAADAYRMILVAKPDYVEVHNNLGCVLEKQGNPTDAAACFERALALKPDYAPAHTNLGIVLMDQNKLDKAAACFERALALKPDFAESHNYLGIILTDQNKLAQAAARFKHALILKPDYAERTIIAQPLRLFVLAIPILPPSKRLPPGWMIVLPVNGYTCISRRQSARRHRGLCPRLRASAEGQCPEMPGNQL